MIGGIAKALLGGSVDKIVDRLIPDVNARKEAKEELNKALVDTANAALIAQIEVNKVEAANPSVFVSGWRPFCGWICGTALCYNFVLQPLLVYALVVYDPSIEAPPTVDLAPLMTVLMGMLGLGGLRTYEKTQGVARQSWFSRK